MRVIEQISKFREEKIKSEFLKLEEELRIEEEKNKKKFEKEIRVQAYFKEQREKLMEFQKIKSMRDMAELQIKQEEERYEEMKD